jgi:hypothetical protein
MVDLADAPALTAAQPVVGWSVFTLATYFTKKVVCPSVRPSAQRISELERKSHLAHNHSIAFSNVITKIFFFFHFDFSFDHKLLFSSCNEHSAKCRTATLSNTNRIFTLLSPDSRERQALLDCTMTTQYDHVT